MSSIRAQVPFLEPGHGLLLKMDDLDKEMYEKASTNIPEEVFSGEGGGGGHWQQHLEEEGEVDEQQTGQRGMVL